MTSKEIRSRFIKFFESRGHSVLPSASLIPQDDPTVLFNTAGMQPLVPFLMGQKHPLGDKLVNAQKCVRTTDIEDIGDNTHATFFEMLGNWSLGSYFKKEAIAWSYEFLTSKNEGLGLDPNRLYVTVFSGDSEIEADNESAQIWQDIGVPKNRIFFKGADSNWWPAVKGKDTWTGPTGPCTEMFYDVTGKIGEIKSLEEFEKYDSEQKIVEIWNDVFMEYEKKDGKIVSKLNQKNVDTGAGLERVAMIMQEKNNVFETDLFAPIVEEVRKNAKTDDEKLVRIITDHVRTSVFMISDGVVPANTDRGYILRRLIRRAVFYADKIGLGENSISEISRIVPVIYKDVYPVEGKLNEILAILQGEELKFRKTLSKGVKEFARISGNGEISGKEAFTLFSTYGFPVELTQELARSSNIKVDIAGFEQELKKHQELSRAGSEKKFKGGLADNSEQSVRYHTATHLLGAALRSVIGESATQRGSNITPERLRFDFNSSIKLSPEQIKQVEDFVNDKIKKNLNVTWEEKSLDEARRLGAIGVFGEKYADTVKVYTIGDAGNPVSMEICGGPHVQRTGELGKFKIAKEEAVSVGVRRIKAVLE